MVEARAISTTGAVVIALGVLGCGSSGSATGPDDYVASARELCSQQIADEARARGPISIDEGMDLVNPADVEARNRARLAGLRSLRLPSDRRDRRVVSSYLDQMASSFSSQHRLFRAVDRSNRNDWSIAKQKTVFDRLADRHKRERLRLARQATRIGLEICSRGRAEAAQLKADREADFGGR